MTYDEHIDCDNQLCEAEDRIIALEVDNKRLEKIINYAGGSPPPAANLRFTDMLLPLETQNERLKEVVEDCKETISYVRQYVANCGLSAEDDCDRSLAMIAALKEK